MVKGNATMHSSLYFCSEFWTYFQVNSTSYEVQTCFISQSLLGSAHLVPCDLRLRSSRGFGGELPALSQPDHHSAGFGDELRWTLAPDAGPVLHRWDRGAGPGIMGDVVTSPQRPIPLNVN